MEIRYLGFDQSQNSRVYRFDVRVAGQETKEVSVTANLAVFRDHTVGIQEGPFLSGNKLNADLERGWEGAHELTTEDVRAYADTKAVAAAQRTSARKTQAETREKPPWRDFGPGK